MSTPEPNKSSRLTTRITDIERQIRRKMGALAQHVAHTELLEESSIQKTEQLKTIVEERLSEIDLLGMQLQDTAASLRRIADQDQKQWIAELESELFSVERAVSSIVHYFRASRTSSTTFWNRRKKFWRSGIY
ncbi:hypothetical protein BIW11_04364 [Tropilaelaps mercedesae]|uniref:Uncharacterized protein n=1 Tax=Tropilaelaps mercedesae TaxID=418985 RepID=A0A1V9X7W0_9ACAR|nr:hypothetical protein BIW11_04364 [Tropilaelaps mercedesae]